MNLFEFSTENYYSKERISAEFKKYFKNMITIVSQDVFWNLLDNASIEDKMIAIDVVDNRCDYNNTGDNHKTFISGYSSFDDITILREFYRYLSKELNTEVAFNGFTEETSGLLYLFNEQQKLYEALLEVNEDGKTIIIPIKELPSKELPS